MAAPTGYHCRVCGKFHEGVPLSYGAAAPAFYYDVPEAERNERALLSSDMCAIDGEHFFIVGNIDIPVIGHDEPFSWTVWVSLSKANFTRAYQLWTTPGRESEPPYFGWLSTSLPGYPETLSLKTNVHTRAVGERPFIELEPTDHPLAVEQRTGITWDRVQEIAEQVLHAE
jgi:hypothetical protein